MGGDGRMDKESFGYKSRRQMMTQQRKSTQKLVSTRRGLVLDKITVDEALNELSAYQTLPLSPSDKALVMQGWNKVLAFRSAFTEALLAHWRLLVACRDPDVQGTTEGSNSNVKGLRRNLLATEESEGAGPISTAAALEAVEKNQDPLGRALMERLWDAQELIAGLLDGAIRSLCPHTQVVQREAYRPLQDAALLAKLRGEEEYLRLECEKTEDYLGLFARIGIRPDSWVWFLHSFTWALETHTPYGQADDFEDLERGAESAFRRAIVQTVCVPAVQAYDKLKSIGDDPLYSTVVPRFWAKLDSNTKFTFGEHFYRTLLEKHPYLLDYFARTDMDSLAGHMMLTLDFVVASVSQLGDFTGSYRRTLNQLGEMHRRVGIPTYAYKLVGMNLLDCLQPLFEKDEKVTADKDLPSSASELRGAFLLLYKEVMSLVYYPMLRQEKQVVAAVEFLELVKAELGWSDRKFLERKLQVEEEISSTGTWHQTSQELEMGARIAWRNSAKCIGRISWNTLQVRDCRHIKEPSEIFAQVEEHLGLATAGTNIQSIMTVFEPKSPNELFGTRFWSSQYVRYACYHSEVEGDESIMGDPANYELTKYLTENNLWTPPDPKTHFDVLPLVLKVPGVDHPYIYQLPSSVIFEVPIEHPTLECITNMGFRWTTVPAISNFSMNLGGVVYQNIPFNGWFVTTEIVRNLMERYHADELGAAAMGLDTNTDPMWRQAVACELERAIYHSFTKNGFTIVDPNSVGQSFCTHVRREREKYGRECPGQWSWIGGLVGPTNPTWHLEMRDFLVRPQYDYCADGLVLHSAFEGMTTGVGVKNRKKLEIQDIVLTGDARAQISSNIPSVLILFGSETGNAEAVARRLKGRLRLLKPRLMSLNEAAGLDIIRKHKISHVLCVCSTFGKGEAPTNAAKFFITPVKDHFPARFSVLALGSTMYPDFCQAGINLQKKLLVEAGMEQMNTLTQADAACGADGVIHEWMHLVQNIVLPPNLEKEILATVEVGALDPPVVRFKWLSGDSVEEPDQTETANGWLCVSNTELLSNTGEGRSTRRVSFEVSEGCSYESGDHLAVQPRNGDGMVKRFLACFAPELVAAAKAGGFVSPEDSEAVMDWQSRQLFDLESIQGNVHSSADIVFKTPVSLQDLLKNQLDLTLSNRNVVDLLKTAKRFVDKLLGSLDSTKGERDVVLQHPLMEKFLALATQIMNASADEKTGMVDDFVAEFPTIVTFLEHFREIFLEDFTAHLLGWEQRDPILPMPEVIAIMHKLQPRYYSISSSNRATPREISLSVGLLKTKTSRGVEIEGVCSHYLCRLKSGVDRVEASVRKSTFRLPENVEAPLLMVGAGTGLAPMMGFLADRALDRSEGKQTGDIHVFFGCRSEKEFIYKDVIGKYEADGLIKVHLALSRDPNMPKKYVQHLLGDMGKELCELLVRNDTHYYVCGDARMAEECFESCVAVLRKHAELSRVAAVHHLKRMRLEGRWQTDVWGIVSNFENAKKSIMKSKKTAAKMWLNYFSTQEEEE